MSPGRAAGPAWAKGPGWDRAAPAHIAVFIPSSLILTQTLQIIFKICEVLQIRNAQGVEFVCIFYFNWAILPFIFRPPVALA